MINVDRRVIIQAPRDAHETRVHITEQKAPTIESVRLLAELEKAARDRIERALYVGDNGFEARIVSYLQAETMQRIVRCLFRLNGRELVAEIISEDARRPLEDLVRDLRDRVALVIAEEVLRAGWPKDL